MHICSKLIDFVCIYQSQLKHKCLPLETKDFSIEGTVVPGLLLCSKNLEQSKSPGTTAPSIEKSLLLMTYKFFIGVIKYFMIHKDSFSTMITLTLFSVFYFIVEMV